MAGPTGSTPSVSVINGNVLELFVGPYAAIGKIPELHRAVWAPEDEVEAELNLSGDRVFGGVGFSLGIDFAFEVKRSVSWYHEATLEVEWSYLAYQSDEGWQKIFSSRIGAGMNHHAGQVALIWRLGFVSNDKSLTVLRTFLGEDHPTPFEWDYGVRGGYVALGVSGELSEHLDWRFMLATDLLVRAESLERVGIDRLEVIPGARLELGIKPLGGYLDSELRFTLPREIREQVEAVRPLVEQLETAATYAPPEGEQPVEVGVRLKELGNYFEWFAGRYSKTALLTVDRAAYEQVLNGAANRVYELFEKYCGAGGQATASCVARIETLNDEMFRLHGRGMKALGRFFVTLVGHAGNEVDRLAVELKAAQVAQQPEALEALRLQAKSLGEIAALALQVEQEFIQGNERYRSSVDAVVHDTIQRMQRVLGCLQGKESPEHKCTDTVPGLTVPAF